MQAGVEVPLQYVLKINHSDVAFKFFKKEVAKVDGVVGFLRLPDYCIRSSLVGRPVFTLEDVGQQILVKDKRYPYDSFTTVIF